MRSPLIILLVYCVSPLNIFALNSYSSEWKLRISVEKANFDFSGFSIRAGLKIRF